MQVSPPRMLSIGVGVSLVVLVASVWFWASTFVLFYESADGLSNAFANRGSIYVKHRTVAGFSMEAAVTLDSWDLLGFGRYTGVRADGASETWREFHVWPLAAAAAILPIQWAVRYRRARRRAVRAENGECVRCGYDCRATPGRCPECGERVIDAAAPSDTII